MLISSHAISGNVCHTSDTQQYIAISRHLFSMVVTDTTATDSFSQSSHALPFPFRIFLPLTISTNTQSPSLISFDNIDNTHTSSDRLSHLATAQIRFLSRCFPSENTVTLLFLLQPHSLPFPLSIDQHKSAEFLHLSNFNSRHFDRGQHHQSNAVVDAAHYRQSRFTTFHRQPTVELASRRQPFYFIVMPPDFAAFTSFEPARRMNARRCPSFHR